MQCTETRSLDSYTRYRPAAVAATADVRPREIVEHLALLIMICAFWGLVLFLAVAAAVR
ncbi:MAG TPA: hypothetical protein VF221_22605 [Chloroflexota bacterium]